MSTRQAEEIQSTASSSRSALAHQQQQKKKGYLDYLWHGFFEIFQSINAKGSTTLLSGLFVQTVFFLQTLDLLASPGLSYDAAAAVPVGATGVTVPRTYLNWLLDLASYTHPFTYFVDPADADTQQLLAYVLSGTLLAYVAFSAWTVAGYATLLRDIEGRFWRRKENLTLEFQTGAIGYAFSLLAMPLYLAIVSFLFQQLACALGTNTTTCAYVPTNVLAVVMGLALLLFIPFNAITLLIYFPKGFNAVHHNRVTLLTLMSRTAVFMLFRLFNLSASSVLFVSGLYCVVFGVNVLALIRYQPYAGRGANALSVGFMAMTTWTGLAMVLDAVLPLSSATRSMSLFLMVGALAAAVFAIDLLRWRRAYILRKNPDLITSSLELDFKLRQALAEAHHLWNPVMQHLAERGEKATGEPFQDTIRAVMGTWLERFHHRQQHMGSLVTLMELWFQEDSTRRQGIALLSMLLKSNGLSLDSRYIVYARKNTEDARIAKEDMHNPILHYTVTESRLHATLQQEIKALTCQVRFWMTLTSRNVNKIDLFDLAKDYRENLFLTQQMYQSVVSYNEQAYKAIEDYGDFMMHTMNDESSGTGLHIRAKEARLNRITAVGRSADAHDIDEHDLVLTLRAQDNGDQSFSIVNANLNALNVLGYQPDTLLRTPLSDLLPVPIRTHHDVLLRGMGGSGTRMSNQMREKVGMDALSYHQHTIHTYLLHKLGHLVPITMFIQENTTIHEHQDVLMILRPRKQAAGQLVCMLDASMQYISAATRSFNAVFSRETRKKRRQSIVEETIEEGGEDRTPITNILPSFHSHHDAMKTNHDGVDMMVGKREYKVSMEEKVLGTSHHSHQYFKKEHHDDDEDHDDGHPTTSEERLDDGKYYMLTFKSVDGTDGHLEAEAGGAEDMKRTARSVGFALAEDESQQSKSTLQSGDRLGPTLQDAAANSRTSMSSVVYEQKMLTHLRTSLKAEGYLPIIRNFQFALRICAFIGLVLAIFNCVYVNDLFTTYEKNSNLNFVGLRRLLIQRISYNAGTLAMINEGLIVDDAEGTIENSARTLLRKDATKLVDIEISLTNVQKDPSHEILYRRPSIPIIFSTKTETYVENMGLRDAEERVVTAARHVADMPLANISRGWDADPDTFFLLQNPPYALMEGMQSSVSYYVTKSQEDMAFIETISLILTIASPVIMLAINLVILYPIVRKVKKNKDEAMQVFMGLSKGFNKSICSVTKERIRMLQKKILSDGVDASQQGDFDELHLEEEEEHRRKSKAHEKHFMIYVFSRIGLFLLLACSFFFTSHFYTFLTGKARLLEAPNKVNYGGYRRAGTVRAAFLLRNMLLPDAWYQKSYNRMKLEAQEAFNTTEYQNQQLTYGLDVSNVDGSRLSMAESKKSSAHNTMLFRDACSIISDEARRTACESFDNQLLKTGLQSAMLRKIELGRRLLEEFVDAPSVDIDGIPIMNNTFVKGALASKDFVTFEEATMVRSTDSIGKSVAYYNAELVEEIGRIVSFRLILLVILITAVVFLVIFVFSPLTKMLNDGIFDSNSLILMIPEDQLMSNEKLKGYVSKYGSE